MAVIVGQRDQIWCVICVKEDGQRDPRTFTNENQLLVVAEQCRNDTYVNGPYFA